MKEPIWILDSIVISIHEMLLAKHGGLSGVRDENLLESALFRPKQRFIYEPTASIYALAASYSMGIIKNHPFIDRNKRTVFTVMAIFLELNNIDFNAPEAEVVVFFEGLASGKITEEALIKWLKDS